eukprot:gb/GFBE01072145.1/.p1 GENE.gb/GFBE01072145.1/~~gb/GFBE01072145.1/.p1  ORF type:complete len:421 (+),score=110.65 gb/GFBE01072145.1/:1-1263(+)
MRLLPALLATAGLAEGHRLRAARASNDAESNPYRQVLKNHDNVQYVADFTIGNQTISGIFDTGSFEIVVRSTKCEDCSQPTTPYSAKKSQTYRENGTVVEHVYGSGPATTVLSYDTVSVGDRLTAKNQAIWEITDHDIEIMNTANFAAIVGIGPSWGFGSTEKTLLMNLHINRFSICLDKRSGHDGFLQWGGQALDDDQMVSAKVTGKYHWSTNFSDVKFGASANSTGGSSKSLCSGKQACNVVVDSGTSLIAAPSHALGALSRMLPDIKEDCSNLHELPNLHFKVDGHELTLPPQAYVMRMKGKKLDGTLWDLLFFKPKIKKVDSCVLAFMGLDMGTADGSETWILGMPFFRYYHTTFDRKQKEMKFARAGPKCKPQPLVATGDEVDTNFVSSESDAYTPLDMQVAGLLPPRLKGQKEL